MSIRQGLERPGAAGEVGGEVCLHLEAQTQCTARACAAEHRPSHGRAGTPFCQVVGSSPSARRPLKPEQGSRHPRSFRARKTADSKPSEALRAERTRVPRGLRRFTQGQRLGLGAPSLSASACLNPELRWVLPVSMTIWALEGGCVSGRRVLCAWRWGGVRSCRRASPCRQAEQVAAGTQALCVATPRKQVTFFCLPPLAVPFKSDACLENSSARAHSPTHAPFIMPQAPPPQTRAVRKKSSHECPWLPGSMAAHFPDSPYVSLNTSPCKRLCSLSLCRARHLPLPPS